MTRPHWQPKYAWLDVLGLISRGPRSVAELVGLTGCTRQTLYRYLKAFREEGLIDPYGDNFGWQWHHRDDWPDAAAEQQNQWMMAGTDPFPFHPSASHVPPDYRDGWNAALAAVAAKQQKV